MQKSGREERAVIIAAAQRGGVAPLETVLVRGARLETQHLTQHETRPMMWVRNVAPNDQEGAGGAAARHIQRNWRASESGRNGG